MYFHLKPLPSSSMMICMVIGKNSPFFATSKSETKLWDVGSFFFALKDLTALQEAGE